VDVLRKTRWPTDVVVLDWETYFDANYKLKSLSTIEFIEDARFEELGVAAKLVFGDRPYSSEPAHFWAKPRDYLKWLQHEYGRDLERLTVVHHNARFDNTIMVRKHGITARYVTDTRDLSRHLDARSRHTLEILCERWHLPCKGDTMQFKGLHAADLTDDLYRALSAYAVNDADRTFDLLAILLPQLTRPQIELPLIHHTLRLYTHPTLRIDRSEADRLCGLMEAQVVKDVSPTGATPAEISGNKSFVALLASALAETGQTVPMKAGKKGMIPALAKDDNAITEFKRHPNPKVRQLIMARQAVKSWPLHLKRVRAMIAQSQASGGWLLNPLNYYGAHTGRWSGGEGINTCNLPTRGGGLQTEIKHIIVPPPGCVLIMADAAQIEARGVAWISGQDDLCEAFRQKRDVYSEFASEVLAAPVRKPMKSDPEPVAKLLEGRRAIGKTGILGMGYGMAHERALEYMESYPELRPKLESGEIDLLFCKQVVETYRRKYTRVPQFWRDIEDVFRYVTRYSTPKSLRNLHVRRDGTTTIIRLPSGRCLFYPRAAISSDRRLRFMWGDLWGGTLTENIVQAMSRDILAEAILFMEKHGFRVAHHVYDSIITVVPEGRQKDALECVTRALTHVPSWAVGWPLGVDAKIGKRYE
jgi:DNA polymerase